MRSVKWGCVMVLVLMCVATMANAQDTKPFQLALVPDVQIVKPSDSVTGFRLSIYGENQDVTGLDLGLVNRTTGDFTGVGLNIITMVDGSATGVMWHPIGYGRVNGDFGGWHAATFFSWLKGDTTGLQSSLVSRNRGDFTGVQLGAYSEVGAHITGLQAGILNRAASVKGVQLGVVNLTDDMYGIQLGLVNHIKQGYLPWFVIANAKF